MPKKDKKEKKEEGEKSKKADELKDKKTTENKAKDKQKDSPKDKPEEKIEAKRPLVRKIVAVVVLLVILLVAAAVGLYFYSPLEKYTRPIFKSVPYPVVIVGDSKSVITSRELIHNTDAVRKFYESQDLLSKGYRVDFGTEKGELRLKIKEKDVLDKLVENKLFEEFAREKGITVTADEAQAEIEKHVTEHGDKKSLELSLKSLYGWDIQEFRDNVVIPQLYMRKLFLAYVSEIREQEGYIKSVQAKRELQDDGSNFVEVVKEFSEGESARIDGELGWFRYHQLIPEVADVVFKMEVGEISEVIISPVGFHIVQVEEKREQEIVGDSEGEGEEMNEPQTITELRLRQVYIHGKTFLNWIFDQKKQTPMVVLMKDYFWNAEEGHIEFSDDSMKRIEKRLRMNSQGDPSIGNAQ